MILQFINGGFMVLNPNIFDYIKEGDATIFEQKPMLQLAKDGDLWDLSMTVSGSVWIHKEKKKYWKIFGQAERPHG